MKLQLRGYFIELPPWGISLFMAMIIFMPVIAQNNAGTARGVVRDSVHNYAMSSATVSIYRSDPAREPKKVEVGYRG